MQIADTIGLCGLAMKQSFSSKVIYSLRRDLMPVLLRVLWSVGAKRQTHIYIYIFHIRHIASSVAQRQNVVNLNNFACS